MQNDRRLARSLGATRTGVLIGGFLLLLLLLSILGIFGIGPGRRLVVRLFGPPAAVLSEAYAEEPGGPSFDHSAFDALLARHVEEGGWVDYAGLGKDLEELDAYLESLAAAPFDEMGRDDKLALLVNAYNAFTLKLILDHHPVDSIRDIPSGERWDAVRWRVGENVWSLNQLEHEQIRPKFREPRIHFALVCAAVGCPPLRAAAYDAERLETQLEEQTRYVHRHGTWLAYDGDANVVELTRLYEWYGGDFEQVAGSVLAYVGRYAPRVAAAVEAGEPPTIRWLEYDWTLNDLAHRQPR